LAVKSQSGLAVRSAPLLNLKAGHRIAVSDPRSVDTPCETGLAASMKGPALKMKEGKALRGKVVKRSEHGLAGQVVTV
jgi:hypothetical protein